MRVFDCSLGNGTNFVKESIPFSDFIDVEHTLINPFGTFPNAYPTPEIVKARMEVLGVNLNDTIVLYTQPNIPGAGRVYHILKNHGFSNVKILNGDLGYWKRYESLLILNIDEDYLLYLGQWEFMQKLFYQN